MSDTIDERIVKSARKNHVCNWCGESINKGQSYHYWAGVHEGEFGTCKTHPECEAAADRTMKHNNVWWWEFWDHERGLADHETREEVTQ